MNFVQEVLNLIERKQEKKKLDLKRDWFQIGRSQSSSLGNPLYSPKLVPFTIKFGELKCNIINGLVSGTGSEFTLPMWSTIDSTNCNVQKLVDSVYSQNEDASEAIVNSKLRVKGDTVLEGNLLVLGTHTIIESTTTQVADNIFQINSIGAPLDAGIEVVVPDGTFSFVFSNELQLWTIGAKSFKAGNIYSDNNVFVGNNLIADNDVNATNNINAGQNLNVGNDLAVTHNATIDNTLNVGVDIFVDNDINIGNAINLDNQSITNITSQSEGLNAENNDNSLPTTAAVKKYTDALSLSVNGDTGVESINLQTEQLAILGSANITTAAQPNNTLIVSLKENIDVTTVNADSITINNELLLSNHTITDITTSAEGLASGSDNSLPTAEAVKNYINLTESYVSNVQLTGNSLNFTGNVNAFNGSVDLSGYADQGPILGLLINTATPSIEKQIGYAAAIATITFAGGVYTIDFNTSLPTNQYICSVTTDKYNVGVDIVSQSQTQLVLKPLEIATGNAATPKIHVTIHL